MRPERITIRPCEFGDLGQVALVEGTSFPERPYTRSDFAYYLATSQGGFIVASKEGNVVGYVIALRDGPAGSIQSIAVLPEFRHVGLGESLMRSAIDHLSASAVRVRLMVSADNKAAVALYRKLSFKETGRVVRRYYPDGSDAIEMARTL